MTDLATRSAQDQALALPADFDPNEGFDHVEQSDFILPRWTVVQPSSRMDNAGKHAGEFYRNFDKKFAPTVDVVVLRLHPSRVLFGDAGEKFPECSSNDGLHGSLPRDPETGAYGACASCAYNPMVNAELADERKRGMPVKACKGGFTYVVVDDREADTLALISLLGTSARAGKMLNTQLRAFGRGMFSGVIRFSTVEQTNDRGRFYVVETQPIAKLEPADIVRYYQKSVAMRGAMVREFEESDDVAAEPGADAAADEVGDADIPF